MLPLQAQVRFALALITVTPSFPPPPPQKKTHMYNNNPDLDAARFKTSVADTGKYSFHLKFNFPKWLPIIDALKIALLAQVRIFRLHSCFGYCRA